MNALQDRLKGFGLSISEEKTRTVKFGRRPWQLANKGKEKLETFNFLGFTHYCGKSRRGYFVMVHKTVKSTFARKLKEIQEWLKAMSNEKCLTARVSRWEIRVDEEERVSCPEAPHMDKPAILSSGDPSVPSHNAKKTV